MQEFDQDQNPPAQSQEQATQDSQLTTPQADQPIPIEGERTEQAAPETPENPGGSSATSDGAPLEEHVSEQQYPTAEEQVAAQAQKESELENARREHSARTGGGEIREGEVAAQRDEHNARAAGQVPDDSAADSNDGTQDAA